EGRYWLVGTYPQLAEQSVKIAFCLGGPDTTAACTDDDDTGDNSNDEELDGKGCSHLPARSGEGLWLLVGLLGLAARRRL
ncbi:MAG: MYXO-CTERM domain-containing protein, partial [Myxococcota bacterium]